jgi:hypothetical protein
MKSIYNTNEAELSKLDRALLQYGETMTLHQFHFECEAHGVAIEDMLEYAVRNPVIETEEFFLFLGY